MDSDQLFDFMDKHGIKTALMAARLGVEPKTLSSYKSRGLPRKMKALSQRVVDEWFAGSTPISITKLNAIEIQPTEKQREQWENSGLVKDGQLTEFALSRLDALADAIHEISTPKTFPLSAHNEKAPSTGNRTEFLFYGQMAAGQPAEIQYTNETLSVISDLDPATHAIFEVNGESGAPHFMDGDRWFVALTPEARTAKKGKPAVFRDENGCYLKIYNGNKVPFSSVNPDHPDVYAGESLKLVGYPVEKVND